MTTKIPLLPLCWRLAYSRRALTATFTNGSLGSRLVRSVHFGRRSSKWVISEEQRIFWRYGSPTTTIADNIKPPSTLISGLPISWRPYAELARLDKPIGTWLLYWPCGSPSALSSTIEHIVTANTQLGPSPLHLSHPWRHRRLRCTTSSCLEPVLSSCGVQAAQSMTSGIPTLTNELVRLTQIAASRFGNDRRRLLQIEPDCVLLQLAKSLHQMPLSF